LAKRVRDSDLENRAARSKLKVRGKPYYKVVGSGLHVGYRKGKRAGMWVVRRYAGASSYVVQTIGEADDYAEANGTEVLNFWQAQDEARKIAGSPARSGPYKVKDAIEDYLVELEGRASYADTRARLHAYALPAFGDKHVDKLTAESIRKWHRDLAHAPKRVRTKSGAAEHRTRPIDTDDSEVSRRRKVSANRILGLLKAALNYAFTEGKTASDVEWRRVRPFKDVNQSRANYLTLAECKRLINAADPEFRLLVRAGLETGARYSHLARLRVNDFNPDSGTLHFRPQSQPGKQGKGFHVVLTEDGQEFFAELVAGRSGSEPLLRREWKSSEQQRPMKAACERAKIDPPVGFHQLRHTWASHAVMGGMPLPVVAKNLGHADTRMVEKHYGHLAPSYVAEAVRKHAPRFGKTPSNVRALP
jgi:integrase